MRKEVSSTTIRHRLLARGYKLSSWCKYAKSWSDWAMEKCSFQINQLKPIPEKKFSNMGCHSECFAYHRGLLGNNKEEVIDELQQSLSTNGLTLMAITPNQDFLTTQRHVCVL